MQLRKAERKRQHLRISLAGPAGSGKTFTALRIAHALGGPIGVIDTENGSSELYAGAANPDGGAFDFAVVDLAAEPGKFSVDNYVRALRAMADAGIRTVVVDSGSHAWAGPGGVLEYVDNVARKAGNKFTAWAEGTPKHNEFLQALLSYPGHLVFTLRSKVEYVQEKDDRGRTSVRKVGLAPVQRDGLDYEMTVAGDLDADTHRLVITKSRCSALADRSFDRPGADVARVLLEWLEGMPEPGPTQVIPDPPPPKWTAAQQRGFFAALGRLQDPPVDYEQQLKPYCLRPEASDPTKPSEMSEARRQRLLVWLSEANNRREVVAWAGSTLGSRVVPEETA